MNITLDGGLVANGPRNLLVSVVIPIYRPRLSDLDDCVKSVLHQSYDNIEILCIDDASDDEDVNSFLLGLVSQRRRITHLKNDRNLGISGSTQRGIDIASGDFILFVDQDDMLASHAVEALVQHSHHADVVYADETLVSEEGFIGNVIFKPSFSPSLLEQCNYINHPFMVRVETLRKVGPLNPALDGAQDHDLLLRLLESGARFKHVAESLYFWRASPDSVSSDSSNKRWAFNASRKAIEQHFVRTGRNVEVHETERDGRFVLSYPPLHHRRVSVIIPTGCFSGRVRGRRYRFLDLCLRSLGKSEHVILDVVIVYDVRMGSDWMDACPRVGSAEMKFVAYHGDFNFSDKVNIGRASAKGDLLLLLNDDTELIEKRSLEAMIGRLDVEGVGAVGAKLLYPDQTIQHAGQVLAPGPHHAFVGWPSSSPGPGELTPLWLEREVSGVTAAALMCKATVFDDVGGFDSAFPNNYNDVDFCLKVWESGHRVVWSPHAVWRHFESKSRDSRVTVREFDEFSRIWPQRFVNDRYLYPNPACRSFGGQGAFPGLFGVLMRLGGRLIGRGRFGRAVRRLIRGVVSS